MGMGVIDDTFGLAQLAKPVSTNDILGAAEWLQAHDAMPGDDPDDPCWGMWRVAKWLEAEARRRERTLISARAARQLTKTLGRKVTVGDVNKALRKVKS